MKKENFCAILRSLVNIEYQLSSLSKALETFCHDTPIFDFLQTFIDDIRKALENEVGDIPDEKWGSHLDWWLNEGLNSEDKWIEVDKKRIPLETPEQLYDFLTKDQ